MNKKGFTLVELMVVIVIIGVLAAVAIPKMMAATNKAKAGEGPQILRAIGNMEAAYKAENDKYVLENTETGISSAAASAGSNWKELGFDQDPFSRYFMFSINGTTEAFTAIAKLGVKLGDANSGSSLSLTYNDTRTAEANLGKLVPNWK